MKRFGWLLLPVLLLTPLAAHPQNAPVAEPARTEPKAVDSRIDAAVRYIKEGRPEWALTLLSALAEYGDPDAQFHLAIMYEHGEGTQPDLKKAFALRTQAAKSGHAGAQADLGTMYFSGKGTTADRKEAIRLFKASAEQGNAGGQRNLALSYLEGTGVEKNPRLGFELMTKAAQQDDRDSCRYLGELYERGKGTKRNTSEGLRWYLRAAVISNHSDRVAHLALAKVYYYGRGIKRDLVKAHMWFSFTAGWWRLVSNPYQTGYEARDFLTKTSARLSSSQREQAEALFKACYDAETFDQAVVACGL
jgi:TPR repeat protein